MAEQARLASGAALGFSGEYTDAETGFVYLRARYYDPTTGQFLSRDPLVAMTGSAYGYVGGNPLNGVDPTGLSWYNPASWTTKTWDNIAAVASVSAAFIPGVDVVAGIVAISAGSVAAVQNGEQGNWTSAALDVAGVG